MTDEEQGRSGNGALPSRWIIIIAATTITLGCVLAYGNAMGGDWALDDFPRIVNNQDIRMEHFSVSRLWTAATSPPEKERWVTNASFALNYYLNGLDPRGYRFVNLSLHALTALGLFFFLVLLIRQLNRDEDDSGVTTEEPSENGALDLDRRALYVAWAVVLLWCVHPVLTQAVNYTAQRGVLLCGLFYVWGLWGVLEWRRRDAWSGTGFLLFAILMGLLSVKSKEIGGTFVVAAGLLYGLEPDRKGEEAENGWMIGLGVGVLFVLVSLYLLGGVDGTLKRLGRIFSSEATGRRRFTTWQRVMTEWRVMVFYLSLVFWPGLNRLNLEHDIQLSTGLVSPPSTSVALFVLSALLVVAYKLRHRSPVIAFGIFWFFLQLVVTSTVLNLELIFEHRVYLASIGPILVFVYLCSEIHFVPRYVSAALVLVLVGVLSWTTHHRNAVWGDTLTLYKDAVKKAPNKPRNQGNLGVAYAKTARELMKTGQKKQAFLHMVKALDHHRIALRKSRIRERPIEQVFTENIDDLLQDLTGIWRKLDERAQEPRWTERLVEWHEEFLYSVHPKYVERRNLLLKQLPDLHIYLAGVYHANGKEKKAEKELIKVVKRHPQRTQEMLNRIQDAELKTSLRKRIEELRNDK